MPITTGREASEEVMLEVDLQAMKPGLRELVKEFLSNKAHEQTIKMHHLATSGEEGDAGDSA